MTLAVIVLAKAPVAGRVKTRLCPPCSPSEAASLAAAALTDTMRAVDRVRCDRRILAVDDEYHRVTTPPGWDRVEQRGGGLDERIAAAFADVHRVGQRAVLVGMDTPQVTHDAIEDAARMLDRADAVLGPATDGGYWLVGLHTPRDDAFVGVPMSRSDTRTRQLERLRAIGLGVAETGELSDVDTIDDARRLAQQFPALRFSATLRRLGLAHPAEVSPGA